jgi:hypothetical protein
MKLIEIEIGRSYKCDRFGNQYFCVVAWQLSWFGRAEATTRYELGKGAKLGRRDGLADARGTADCHQHRAVAGAAREGEPRQSRRRTNVRSGRKRRRALRGVALPCQPPPPSLSASVKSDCTVPVVSRASLNRPLTITRAPFMRLNERARAHG